MNSSRLGRGLRGATGGLLVALLALSFSAPATATDIATLRDRAQAAADSLSTMERKLAGLESRASLLTERIDAANQELATLELSLRSAQLELGSAQDLLVERAIEAYKSEPSSQLGILLSAETLSDAYDLAEMQSQVASGDAESVAALVEARDSALATQTEIDGRKQALLADEARAEALRAEVAVAVHERRAVLAELAEEIETLEEQARRAAEAAAAASGSTVGQELLDILMGSGPSQGIPSTFASTGVSFEGLASWYGPGFEGNPTANGDIFDSSLYTAASKELPLGSWLYVEYEGRGVVVYVNDRGPYVGDRILDLSRAAAGAIGMEGAGVGWIRAEILIKL